MKKENAHTTREGWLRSAANELRPYFEMSGYVLPEKIRFAIAFTSGGKKGMTGECWPPEASGDGHFEIIIKADREDPLEILSVLFSQLIRTLLPRDVKYGKEFREIALRLGLEGKMRQATPTPALREHLASIANDLGQLPHARLDFNARPETMKKTTTKMLKAECPVCNYYIRVALKNARRGLPVCPLDEAHGRFTCELPDEDILTVAGKLTVPDGVASSENPNPDHFSNG